MTANTPKLPIYLDYQATTPLDSRVLDKMMPFFTEHFGNPHSAEHRFGWQTEAAVNVARGQAANVIGADDDEIIFTSGATESNNIAIKGGAFALAGKKKHVITVKTEHECVLASFNSLERLGFTVTYLDVDNEGLIHLSELENAITENTSLVSVMAVNNEIGVIQDLKAIGDICKKHEVLFHTDAAQGFGKIPLDVNEMNIDLVSISGHKIYGPKGIGALYIRKGVQVIPLFDGGGQEQGIRSGTLAPALCVGLGAASQIAKEEMEKDADYLAILSKSLLENIKLNNIRLNGSVDHRIPGNLNLTFEGVKSDLLIAELKNIAISSGSACSSAKQKSSYVLEAIGLSKEEVDASIRIGFGRMTTEAEIEYTAEYITETVRKLS
ncbi:cysteine desulfurase family protein [Pseudemcibacter aquimaris]|uniref:cysteine desulfurase family protein n=1 Tax=Pseudemcibacter aquimaris TaxID=2857064 RepID=UPI00201363C7|nr:IscS subfamily cysteine desulfurase [Pseudemcibacter aquimaris]MCC3860919.1 IscS subfamily cysteine desulfurase [Pseudemcibacter aquimaris]WDU59738.1 IscS subfamily cysteine desulfurase [Pseudemcibacter aquimaris]